METKTILSGYSDTEKGAYLGAIASLATADHSASDEELAYLTELAEAAGISETQKQMVLQAAKEITGDELQQCIEILKTSELRFSLITDLISFSKSDGNYDEQEKGNIEKMAQQLSINQKQFSLLEHFVNKSNDVVATEEPAKRGFLESLGLGDKFKEQGINMSGLSKGLLAIAAPLLLSKLFMGGNRNRMGGNMAPRMGGFGGGSGGLGSILSALSMGRGFGSTGGLLSRIMGGRRL